jgi:AAA domain/Bifunctional DNA primase/polymerase, N-terminal
MVRADDSPLPLDFPMPLQSQRFPKNDGSKLMTTSSAAVAASPYKEAGARLIDAGYSALPVEPGTKRPGTMLFGEWRGLSDWTRFCDRIPTGYEIPSWEGYPDSGVCVATGFNGLVAIDIDTDEPEIVAAIMNVLPESSVIKKGAKGKTLFYRGDVLKTDPKTGQLSGCISSRGFDVGGHRALDILAYGKQSVLPPTIHPNTGKPYQWLTDDTLEDTAIELLPVLPDNIEDLLSGALAPFGYVEPIGREYKNAEGGGSYWHDLNQLALANLDNWVPDVGLPDTARVNAYNWRAVAGWREVENPNLSFHSTGIRDFGNGETHSPIDVVGLAKGLDFSSATEWLANQLNFVWFAVEDNFDVLAFIERVKQRKAREAENTSDSPSAGVDESSPDKKPGALFEPTVFEWEDPSEIPLRDWLYGKHLIRRHVSATIASGAVGKTSLKIVEALALVTGRALLGQAVSKRLNVWLFNLEDDLVELRRRVTAAMIHYNINPEDIGDRLHIDGEKSLLITKSDHKGTTIREPIVEALVDAIKKRKIDVLIIDPFISSHDAAESDSGAMDLVMKSGWVPVARLGNCAVELCHHTTKADASSGMATAMSGRGSGAVVFACRSVQVLNPMTYEQAKKAALDSPSGYFSAVNDKENLTLKTGLSDWYKMESVSLGNGGIGNLSCFRSDSVGVVTRFQWPSNASFTAGVTGEQLRTIKDRLKAGAYRKDPQAKAWAGYLVGEVLGLGLSKEAMEGHDRQRIIRMLDSWLKAGHLKVYEEKVNRDPKPKQFLTGAEPA